MPSDTHESPIGTPHPDAIDSGPKTPESLDITGPAPASPPSTASGDELSLLLAGSITQPEPDPFLDEYAEAKPPRPAPEAPTPGVSAGSFDAVGLMNAFTDPHSIEPVTPAAPPPPPRHPVEPVIPIPVTSPLDSGSSDLVVNPLAALGAVSGSDSVSQPASFDAFPHMDLSAPPSREAGPKPRKPAEVEDEDDDDDDDFEDLPSRRSSVGTMLLFSYASAVTLGLIWVLWSGRRLKENDEDPFPPAAVDARPDPGARAGQSRKLTPAPALPADHLTSLGKTIRMGDLEATPLEVASGKVRLIRSFGENQPRDGGGDALMLKLRLKNVSRDSIFAPLDEGFLRERRREVNDSLIETSDGQQIAMYPLAVTSEQSIVGQEFRELKPGDSYETWVVSAPDSIGRKTPEMTWRVRLRTGIEQTDTLGVRFQSSEIKPRG